MKKATYAAVCPAFGNLNIEIVGKLAESAFLNDDMHQVGAGIGDHRAHIYAGIGLDIIGDQKRSHGNCCSQDQNRAHYRAARRAEALMTTSSEILIHRRKRLGNCNDERKGHHKRNRRRNQQ